MKKLILLPLIAILLSGCATIDYCYRTKTMVDIENSGWLLFNFIPIACGNTDKPNEASFRWFSNEVTLENNMKMLRYAMKETGATQAREVSSFISDEYVLVILLKRHAFHTSAELVTDTPPNQLPEK